MADGHVGDRMLSLVERLTHGELRAAGEPRERASG
jgi:hypothetical protein